MNRQEEYNERVAICEIDGGLSSREAHRVAVDQMRDATQGDCPEAWTRLSRRWHALATEVYGRRKLEKVRDAIKQKHSAESFTHLTLGEIQDSIDKLEAK